MPLLSSWKSSLRLLPRLRVAQIARNYSVETTNASSATLASQEPAPTTFASLPIHPKLIAALSKLKFESMTPVQQKAIGPLLSTKRGIVARAKTGTGKTLAFGLPVLHDAVMSRNSESVLSLVVAPTRDLANQISAEFLKVYPGRELDILVAVGGSNKFRSIKQLLGRRVPPIVVGTPGRILDLLSDTFILKRFAGLRYKVYDEADRLLDQGFEETLTDIDSALKKVRSVEEPLKTVLFSATIDQRVHDFAQTELGEKYVYVDCVDKNDTEAHTKIDQQVIVAKDNFDVYVAALELLVENPRSKLMVFMPTVKAAAFFHTLLKLYTADRGARLRVMSLHGQMLQMARDRSVAQFRTANSGVLVTTNVGARGMDFPGVSHVYQMNLPSEMSDYIHRIGRTARGNATSGSAILLINSAEERGLKMLQRRKIQIKNETLFSEAVPNAEEARKMVQALILDERRPVTDRKGMQEAGSNEEAVKNVFLGLLGGLLPTVKEYRLDPEEFCEAVVGFYKGFLGTEEKPRLPLFLDKTFPSSVTSDYFEGGSRGRGGRGDFKKRDNFRGNGYRDDSRRGDSFKGDGFRGKSFRSDGFRRNDRNGGYRNNKGRKNSWNEEHNDSDGGFSRAKGRWNDY